MKLTLIAIAALLAITLAFVGGRWESVKFELEGSRLLAMFLTAIGVGYAISNFRRKIGVKVRGTFYTNSSFECSDPYISSVTLENLKDRALVIFGIYIKVDHHVYIELDNFGREPQIVKPYEVFRKEYGPIDYYGNLRGRIAVRKLMWPEKVRQKVDLVIATTDGKFRVKEFISPWDPSDAYFRNQLTCSVRPKRTTYKGKGFGGNIAYVVDFDVHQKEGGQLLGLSRDERYRELNPINVARADLASRETVTSFIQGEMEKNRISRCEFRVYDLDAFRARRDGGHKREYDALALNWFEYHVLGRIATRRERERIRLLNKANAESRKINCDLSLDLLLPPPVFSGLCFRG